MLEFVEKIVFTGIGFLSFSLEKAKNIVEELVKEEKISPEEGEKIVRELMRDAINIKEEVEYQLKQALEQLVPKLSFFNAEHQRLNDLIARIEALEESSR